LVAGAGLIMGRFAYALRAFGADLVPMAIFLVVVLATRNILAATAIGMAAGVGQLIWTLARRQPIGAIQWASLGLVALLGGATLLTRDPRFIMLKPTAAHLFLGAVMLRPGWMERYAPAEVRDVARPMLTAFGFVWAALMFVTAALNLAVMLLADPMSWAKFNLIFPPGSMIALFAIQNLVMRRRLRGASGLHLSRAGGGQ
jgi:intracellular septation protein A